MAYVHHLSLSAKYLVFSYFIVIHIVEDSSSDNKTKWAHIVETYLNMIEIFHIWQILRSSSEIYIWLIIIQPWSEKLLYKRLVLVTKL